jgi:hypothetical protein
LDGRQVEAANDAMTRIRATVTGLVRQLTIHLAPFIEATANFLLQMGDAGWNAADLITSGMERAVRSVAAVADVTGFVQKGFYALRIVAFQIVKSIVSAFMSAMVAINEGVQDMIMIVASLASHIPKIGKQIEMAMRQMRNEVENNNSSIVELGKLLEDNVQDVIDETAAKFQEIDSNSYGNRVTDMFANIRRESERIAMESDKTKMNYEDVADMSDPTRRGGFSQITRSVTVVGGASTRQQKTPIVADPREITLLQQIHDRLLTGMIAGAA